MYLLDKCAGYLFCPCVFLSDDEEVSLVIEAACPDAVNENHAAEDDTLSVGPDMPDLPLDAPPDPETSAPPAPAVDASTPEEVVSADKEETEESPEVEPGAVEEESTVREETPPAEPPLEQEEGPLGEQQEESGGAVGEDGGGEEEQGEEVQEAASAPPADEDATVGGGEDGEETQPKPDSDNLEAAATNSEAAADEAQSEEAPGGPVEADEGAPQEVTEGGDRNCTPCTCQSIFSNYNSHAPSRRKNRPCSLPVSELETVIASACGEPETPRSHYIRIHHLLHSLPSAQLRAPSTEEEDTGDGENTGTEITSPTLKTSKEEEGQEEDDEDDTTLSPSQVRPVTEGCISVPQVESF